MAVTSKDIEILWERFTSEGVSKGISVHQYFESNGIPYHVFEKWYKKKFQQAVIADCVVEGAPSSASHPDQPSSSSSPAQASSKEVTVNNIVIYLSNGMKIEHRRLSYVVLLSFIQKLKPLCLA